MRYNLCRISSALLTALFCSWAAGAGSVPTLTASGTLYTGSYGAASSVETNYSNTLTICDYLVASTIDRPSVSHTFNEDIGTRNAIAPNKCADCHDINGNGSCSFPPQTIQGDTAHPVEPITDDSAYVCAIQKVLSTDEPSGGTLYSSCKPLTTATTCDASDVTIDHGTLTPSQFDGNTRTGFTTIRCSGDATVALTVSPSTVSLSNSGTSHLSFSDNSSSSVDVTVPGNSPKDVNLTSRLQGAPGPGTFSGSSTLVITVE